MSDVPLNSYAQGVIQGIAAITAGLPDVCSGGGFFYGGVQGDIKGAHVSANYLGNVDSKSGYSGSGLGEGSGAKGPGVGATTGGEGLVFIPFAGAAGGVVGPRKMASSLENTQVHRSTSL